MKNNDWYIVKNFDEFINATRALVFNSFGEQQNEQLSKSSLDVVEEEEQEEFNKILSYEESVLIVKEFLREQTNRTTYQKRYLVSDEVYLKIVDALNHRMVGNLLNNLVNKGLVESSFDNEANDFVFWIKDEDQTKPETD